MTQQSYDVTQFGQMLAAIGALIEMHRYPTVTHCIVEITIDEGRQLIYRQMTWVLTFAIRL